jgi:prepilin-type N-terminal cleavage/methylation domain-containing protein
MIFQRTQPARRRRGFTLIESMATIAVLGALGSTASFLILDAVDDYTDASLSVQLHAEMSIALDRAMRELRKIELDATASGVAPDLDSMIINWITWTDSSGNAYQLGKAGTELQLEVAGGGLATLLTDVTAVTFTIFDEDNVNLGAVCAAATCDPVRRISLDVTTSRSGVSQSLRFKAFIRSTMSGAQGGA